MRAKMSLVIAALAAIVTLPAYGADWPVYRNGALRHNYTAEDFTPPFSLVWKFTTAPAAQLVPPAVTRDRVFWAAGLQMYCLDIDTGAPLWRYDAQDTILGAPSVAEGMVLFGADDGRVVALNADTGELVWAAPTARAIRAAPLVVDGVVYAASLDRRVMAIDASTGGLRWSVLLTDELWGAPAAVGGSLFVPTSDGQIFALDTDDGRPRMRATLPRRRALQHPLVVTRDAVYAAGRSELRALTRRGIERWAKEFDAFVAGAPALSDGRLYLALIDGRLFGIDTEKGRTLWEFDFKAETSSPPTAVGDVVIAGAVGGIVYALDAVTGTPRWRYLARPPGLAAGVEAGFDLAAAPVYSNGSLYLVWDDGSLARFDAHWPDLLGPTVRLLTPAESNATGTSLPKLVGAQVFDEESGLDYASLTMQFDDTPLEAAYDPYSGYFTYTISNDSPLAPIQQGWHTITITARDQRGNETSRTWRFVAQPGGEVSAIPTRPGPGGEPAASPPSQPAPVPPYRSSAHGTSSPSY